MVKKADTTETAKAPAKERKTRTILSPAERIAKAQADLAAMVAKAQTAAKAKVAGAEADLAKLVEKRDALNTKIEAKQSEVDELKAQAGEPVTEDEPVSDES